MPVDGICCDRVAEREDNIKRRLLTMKDEIVLYQPDAEIQLEVRLQDETVWLTQQQMAMLFGVKENNITYHIQGIYKTRELEPEATTQKIRVLRLEGKRKVMRPIDFYNLDMIISHKCNSIPSVGDFCAQRIHAPRIRSKPTSSGSRKSFRP